MGKRTLIDQAYRRFVRSQPCVVAVALGHANECQFDVQFCHLKHSGMGGKNVPDHGNAWPGCLFHHAESGPQESFQRKYNIDLEAICLQIEAEYNSQLPKDGSNAVTKTITNTKLAQLEAMIERGLQTFVNIGNALREIRDAKLYTVGFDTFDAYCRERWGFERTYAHRLMSGAEVVERLRMLPMGNKAIPTTERQARPLTKLKPAQQPAAWERAVEKAGAGTVTAKVVEEAVADLIGSPPVTVHTTDGRLRHLRGAARCLREAQKLCDAKQQSRLAEVLHAVGQLMTEMGGTDGGA